VGYCVRQSDGSGAHSRVPRVPVHFTCHAREVRLLPRLHTSDEPHLRLFEGLIAKCHFHFDDVEVMGCAGLYWFHVASCQRPFDVA
jgi:hypothetical protein